MSLWDGSDKCSAFQTSFPSFWFSRAYWLHEGESPQTTLRRGEGRWPSYPHKVLWVYTGLCCRAASPATPRLVTSKVQLVLCGGVLSKSGGGGIEWGNSGRYVPVPIPVHLSLILKFLHTQTSFLPQTSISALTRIHRTTTVFPRK